MMKTHINAHVNLVDSEYLKLNFYVDSPASKRKSKKRFDLYYRPEYEIGCF